MKKYKVEFVVSDKFVVDVLAKNEDKAIEKAIKSWNKIEQTGTEHLHQTDCGEAEIGAIYDVTNTDDHFNPQ